MEPLQQQPQQPSEQQPSEQPLLEQDSSPSKKTSGGGGGGATGPGPPSSSGPPTTASNTSSLGNNNNTSLGNNTTSSNLDSFYQDYNQQLSFLRKKHLAETQALEQRLLFQKQELERQWSEAIPPPPPSSSSSCAASSGPLSSSSLSAPCPVGPAPPTLYEYQPFNPQQQQQQQQGWDYGRRPARVDTPSSAGGYDYFIQPQNLQSQQQQQLRDQQQQQQYQQQLRDHQRQQQQQFQELGHSPMLMDMGQAQQQQQQQMRMMDARQAQMMMDLGGLTQGQQPPRASPLYLPAGTLPSSLPPTAAPSSSQTRDPSLTYYPHPASSATLFASSPYTSSQPLQQYPQQQQQQQHQQQQQQQMYSTSTGGGISQYSPPSTTSSLSTSSSSHSSGIPPTAQGYSTASLGRSHQRQSSFSNMDHFFLDSASPLLGGNGRGAPSAVGDGGPTNGDGSLCPPPPSAASYLMSSYGPSSSEKTFNETMEDLGYSTSLMTSHDESLLSPQDGAGPEDDPTLFLAPPPSFEEAMLLSPNTPSLSQPSERKKSGRTSVKSLRQEERARSGSTQSSHSTTSSSSGSSAATIAASALGGLTVSSLESLQKKDDSVKKRPTHKALPLPLSLNPLTHPLVAKVGNLLKSNKSRHVSSVISHFTSSAEGFKRLAQELDGFLFILSSSGSIIFASNSCAHYFGVSTSLMIGQSIGVYLHPEDEELVMHKLEEAFDQAKGLSVYCRFKRYRPGPQTEFYSWLQQTSQEHEGPTTESVEKKMEREGGAVNPRGDSCTSTGSSGFSSSSTDSSQSGTPTPSRPADSKNPYASGLVMETVLMEMTGRPVFDKGIPIPIFLVNVGREYKSKATEEMDSILTLRLENIRLRLRLKRELEKMGRDGTEHPLLQPLREGSMDSTDLEALALGLSPPSVRCPPPAPQHQQEQHQSQQQQQYRPQPAPSMDSFEGLEERFAGRHGFSTGTPQGYESFPLMLPSTAQLSVSMSAHILPFVQGGGRQGGARGMGHESSLPVSASSTSSASSVVSIGPVHTALGPSQSASSSRLSTAPSDAARHVGKKRKKTRPVIADLVCRQCGTNSSPEWRRGPDGPKTLCNACGLLYAKKTKLAAAAEAAAAALSSGTLG